VNYSLLNRTASGITKDRGKKSYSLKGRNLTTVASSYVTLPLNAASSIKPTAAFNN
jgi:hypothetical protein